MITNGLDEALDEEYNLMLQLVRDNLSNRGNDRGGQPVIIQLHRDEAGETDQFTLLFGPRPRQFHTATILLSSGQGQGDGPNARSRNSNINSSSSSSTSGNSGNRFQLHEREGEDVMMLPYMADLAPLLLQALAIQVMLGEHGRRMAAPLEPENMRRLQRMRICRDIVTRLESEGQSVCSICQDAFSGSAEVYRLPCGHMFDVLCLEQWLQRTRTCPNCRFLLQDLDQQYKDAVAPVWWVGEVGVAEEQPTPNPTERKLTDVPSSDAFGTSEGESRWRHAETARDGGQREGRNSELQTGRGQGLAPHHRALPIPAFQTPSPSSHSSQTSTPEATNPTVRGQETRPGPARVSSTVLSYFDEPRRPLWRDGGGAAEADLVPSVVPNASAFGSATLAGTGRGAAAPHGASLPPPSWPPRPPMARQSGGHPFQPAGNPPSAPVRHPYTRQMLQRTANGSPPPAPLAPTRVAEAELPALSESLSPSPERTDSLLFSPEYPMLISPPEAPHEVWDGPTRFGAREEAMAVPPIPAGGGRNAAQAIRRTRVEMPVASAQPRPAPPRTARTNAEAPRRLSEERRWRQGSVPRRNEGQGEHAPHPTQSSVAGGTEEGISEARRRSGGRGNRRNLARYEAIIRGQLRQNRGA